MSDESSIQLYTNILNKEVETLSAEAKASLDEVKKVALSQAWKLLQLAIAKIIQTLETIATDLSGPEKKIVAMTSLSLFYDNVLQSISIPMIPSWLEPILRQYIKSIFMVLISSSIDAMVATFRQIGIFVSKSTVKSQSKVTRKRKKL
jgi:hypothetical protein